MIIFAIAILILYFACARYNVHAFHADYISRDAIQPIKGLFILFVFMSHFVLYISPHGCLDSSYMAVRRVLGQMIVVPFLFYSGYGVTLQIVSKRKEYLKPFLIKRIVRTVLLFDVAVLLYIVLRWSVFGTSFSAERIFLCLLGWLSAGNSNWYIFSIVILYFLTYLCFGAFCDISSRYKDWYAFGTLVVAVSILIGVLQSCRPDYVYNTLFAYLLGCCYPMVRRHFEGMFFSSGRAWLLCLSLTVLAYWQLNSYRAYTAVSELIAVVFSVLIVLLSGKVLSKSRILSYCGRHLFSLYILQRLPMYMLKETCIADNRYVYFFTCLAITFLISAFFDGCVVRMVDGLMMYTIKAFCPKSEKRGGDDLLNR